MSFEFCVPPRTGGNWAKLYDLAAAAIGKDGKLCYSTFQTDDYKGVCASSAVAMGLCTMEQLRDVFPVVEEGVNGAVFDFNKEDDFGDSLVHDALAKAIAAKFSEDELAVMVSQVHHLTGGDRSDARYIADDLVNFLIEHNDSFYVGTRYEGAKKFIPEAIAVKYATTTDFGETFRESNDPDLMTMEVARAKFVKAALEAAAQQARA